MISRIQISCKNGVKFEDAMTQALSEILQNLQVINEDTKKPRCRTGSVPAIWYATEERTTTFKQSNKVVERRCSEITTSALSTMPALQSLEEEKVNAEQVDIGLHCQDEVIQEDGADRQKEDVDIQHRGLIRAPAKGTSETTTPKQPKKEMKRKMSVFTAPALSAMPSLQSLEEDEVNLDQVTIGLGCQGKVIEEDSADKQIEDVDIQPRRRISAAVRGTSETTTLTQPKKKLGRKFSVFSALSATPSLQSLEEEKVDIDEVDMGLGNNDKVIQEVRADKQREDVDIQPRSIDMQLRRRISAPVIGTSELTAPEQPKKEMIFSVFPAPVLSTMPSLQALDKEEVNLDKLSFGLGCQDKVIEEDSAEKRKEDGGTRPRRRRISAPVIGTSDTTTLKQPKKKYKRKSSVFPAPTLSATPSLQSLDEEKVNIDEVDISLGCQDKVIQEFSAVKQREDVDIQPRRRRISAPVIGTSETTTPKQSKQKMRRKFSLFPSPALSATSSLKSLDEEQVNIDEADIGFGYNDRAIERDIKKQPRRRRVSAPARTYRETAETTTFKQLKKDLVRKMSRPTLLPDVALPTMPWLVDCVENQMEKDFEPVEFSLSFLDDLMKSV